MSLVEFKNLPDTTTPINAANLNHNFNELNSQISAAASAINNLKGSILWTNSAPNNGFDAQKVQLDLSRYDGVAIIYIIDSGAVWGRMIKNTGIMPIQSTRPISMEGTIVENTSSSTFAFRSATVSSTGITFGTGYNNITNSGATERNNACVPWYIIGYNTGTFN